MFLVVSSFYLTWQGVKILNCIWTRRINVHQIAPLCRRILYRNRSRLLTESVIFSIKKFLRLDLVDLYEMAYFKTTQIAQIVI